MKIISNVGEPNVSRVFIRMAERMRPGHETFFASISGRIDEELAARGHAFLDVERLVSKNFEEISRKPLYAKLAKLYSPAALKQIYGMDYVLRGLPSELLEKKTLAYLAVWMELFGQQKPNLVVSLDGTSLFDTTAKEVCDATGTPILFCNGTGPIAGTVYWDSSNMLNSWVRKKFLSKTLTPADRKRVAQYVEKTTSEKPVQGGKRQAIVSGRNAAKYVKYVWNYVWKEKLGTYHGPVSLARERVKQLIRPHFARKYYSTQPLEKLFSQKFVYFPLQTPDDAQITARGIEFEQQDEWAVTCARALPKGVKLYVKEHPQGIGAYPLKWYANMRREPNIEILPPSVSSHDLIKNSLCVITINSTAGWESILYRKPAVVLGKPFYAGLGVTFDYKGGGGKELEKLAVRAIKSGELPKEKVERVVNAVLHSLWPASFYKFENGRREIDAGDGSVQIIIEALKATYEEKFGKKFK